LPSYVANLYKPAWETSIKMLSIMSAESQFFVDQMQSFNMFIKEPKTDIMVGLLKLNWELGLKTLIYYLRTVPRATNFEYTVTREITEPVISIDTAQLEILEDSNKARSLNLTQYLQAPTSTSCLSCSG